MCCFLTIFVLLPRVLSVRVPVSPGHTMDDVMGISLELLNSLVIAIVAAMVTLCAGPVMSHVVNSFLVVISKRLWVRNCMARTASPSHCGLSLLAWAPVSSPFASRRFSSRSGSALNVPFVATHSPPFMGVSVAVGTQATKRLCGSCGRVTQPPLLCSLSRLVLSPGASISIPRCVPCCVPLIWYLPHALL